MWQVIKEEKLQERAFKTGLYLLKQLERVKEVGMHF